VSRRRIDPIADEVRTELDAHMAALVDDNLRRGLSNNDAEREAAERFGRRTPIEASSTRVRRRSLRAWRTIGPDVHDAWRRLSRRPLSALCAFIVTTVGVTTIVAALRLVDALLVRPPLGVTRPNDVYSVLDTYNGEHIGLVSYPTFLGLAAAVPEVGMFAWEARDLQIIAGAEAHVWTGVVASGAYFKTLGTRPAAGRLLDMTDDDGARPSAVVSERLARRLAGAATAVVGRAIRVNGQAFEIVGVAERGFQGVESGHPVDVWVPLSSEPAISTPTIFPDGHRVQGFRNTPSVGWLRLAVRRPAGVTPLDLESRLTSAIRGPAVAQYASATHRRVNVSERVWLPPFPDELARVASTVRMVAWAAGLTLVLASACIAGIFVGRLADRAREIALRMALGAGRARLLRVAFAEVALVVSAGALAAAPLSAVVLASAGRLQLTGNVSVADAMSAPFDARALGLSLLVAGVLAVAASIAPLIVVAQLGRTTRVESTRATVGGTRMRRLLLIAQVASGCAFLTGALLLTRSIAALEGQALGYDADHVAFAELDPAGAGLNDDARAALVERLAAYSPAAGVELAFADEAPYAGGRQLFVSAEGAAVTRTLTTPTSRVSADYFRVLGVPVVSGRAFTNADSGRQVAVLSEPAARYYWPRGDAVGHLVRVGGPGGIEYQVVGVVTGVRDAGLKGQPGARIYLPYSRDAEALTLLAKRPGAPASDAVRALVAISRGLDERLVLIRSGSLLDLAWRTIEQRVLIRFVVVTIGLGSLLMIATGVWGLSHSSLRRRWREFGIRRALGATGGHIRRLALADAFVVTAAGAAAGLAGSWGMGVLLKTWLYQVTDHDPWSMVGGMTLVVVATFAGALLPVRNASRLEPTVLLRDE